MSANEIKEFVALHKRKHFYVSRLENYLGVYSKSTRQVCCREKLHTDRKHEGFQIFQNLLLRRGEHYNTEYTLLLDKNDYNGKHEKYKIRCETHGSVFEYSMQNLNYTTSCPCPECRKDSANKNMAVPIIQKRNILNKRKTMNAQQVKQKYGNACALSKSSTHLHYHHLDVQDFYVKTQNSWQHVGICLLSTIHRDYHYNFLKNHSQIARKYSNIIKNLTLTELPWTTQEDPDDSWEGAEVSRYTFLEYLRFLLFDIRSNNSIYVNSLNNKIQEDFLHSKQRKTGQIELITYEKVERAMHNYCQEFKGASWALANDKEIPFANDKDLWAKVDATWN